MILLLRIFHKLYTQFFENVGIKTSVDKLRMTVDGIQDGVQMKAHVTDATGEQYTVTYLNKGDGIVEATLPKALSYPIELARVYVVAVGTTSQIKGSLLIESIETVSKLDESDLFEVVDIKPIDSLYEVYPSTDSDTVTLFGATGGRNRLLDEVVLEKVYTVLNKSDYAIYAGTSVVDEEKITNQHLIYKNSFEVVDLPSVRIITLAMSEGSVISTDSSQWSKLNSALSGSTQENVIIVGNSKLVDSSKPESNKEGKFIHETLKDFCKKSGKKVFFVNASGYKSNLEYYEGIRYIDLNGLWYKVGEDHEVDLYDSFQTLSFSFEGSDVTYKIDDLYPKTTISN